MDRRTLLGTVAATTLAAGAAVAKAPMSGKQAPGYFRMRLGAFEITSVNDGFARRPVTGFVKNASDEQVSKALDEANRPTDSIITQYTNLVINTGEQLVMLDACNGDMGPPTSGTWMANFKAAGFDPKDVDVIIFTHFHGDHINGYRLKDGSTPFTNAQVMVPAAEWAFWMDDARMAAAPEASRGAFANCRRVFSPIADKVVKFEPGQVIPGIKALPAYGHSPGHTVFQITSGETSMMALADTTNVPELFARHPDWHVIFDADAAKASAMRKQLFGDAAEGEYPVHLYHAAFPAIGHMEREGEGFDFKPMIWSSAL